MIVYQALFPNGKKYIGKTKDFSSRKEKHRVSPKYYSTKIAKAIEKYGFENVEWSVIFESEDSLFINQKEKEFIYKFDTINNGYNISTGGDGGDTISHNDNKNDIIKKQLETKGFKGKFIFIDEKIGQEIIDIYKSDVHGTNFLADKYGISKKRIMRFLKKNGVELDKDRSKKVNTFIPSNELMDRIIDRFKSGKLIKEIALEENLTIMIVSRILHDSGVRESKRFKNGKRYDGKQPKNRKLDNQD